MNAIQQSPSVLDPVIHRRFMADIANIVATAGIPVDAVHQSAVPLCSKDQLEWLQFFPAYRQHGKGLVITGVQSIAPDAKMIAITAALLRNFIDARMMTLSRMVSMLETGELEAPTVLLIPNLFVKSVGKALPDWKVQQVYDLLLQRVMQGKPIVAYVEDMGALRQVYGEVFAQHLEAHNKITE